MIKKWCRILAQNLKTPNYKVTQFIGTVHILRVLLIYGLSATFALFSLFLFNFNFTDFANAQPSIATFKGVNAEIRITAFYTYLLVFALSFLTLSAFLNKVLLARIRLPNSIIIILILLSSVYIFRLYQQSYFLWSNATIISLVIFFILSIFLRSTSFKNHLHKLIPCLHIFSAAIIWYKTIPNLAIYYLIVCVVLSAVSFFWFKKSIQFIAIALPIISILIIEFSFNQINYQLGIQWPFYAFFGTALLILTIIYNKTKRAISSQLPFLLFNLAIIAFYTLTYIDNLELFEKANPASSLIRNHFFDQIPFVHYMSSHVLSEQFPLFVYQFIHGTFIGIEFMRFEHLLYPFTVLTCFFFLKNTIKSAKWAALIIVAFPFIDFILIPYYTALLLTVLLYWWVIKTKERLTILNK
ncbi:MAG: hypothetical protein ACPGLV_10935 [Bacteroidia bacterium]